MKSVMKTIKAFFGIFTITAALAVSTQAQPASSFVWTKLASLTSLPSGWSIYQPGMIDVNRGIIYSLSNDGIFWKYDIQSNLFTQLPVTGWPGVVGQKIYNPDENTIWLTLNGRGQVYRLPVTGGAVTLVGASGASTADYSNVGFWNSVTHKFSTVFGYGLGAVRNWRWEFGTNDSNWVQIEANTPGRAPWQRVIDGNGTATLDIGGQRLFVYGEMGNSTGNQGQLDAGFSNNGNQFDWLKDLWELDFKSNTWTNLIPLNTSIPIAGGIVYFPPKNILFMVNGYQIPANANPSVYVTGLWTFNVGQSTNWTQVVATGDVPNVADEVGFTANSFYDQNNQRIIHFNNAGVYALNLGPQIGLLKAVKPSFSYLAVGTNYQLQVSGDLNTWTNQGSAFTATNSSMVYPQYFDVANWNQLFFRLQLSP